MWCWKPEIREVRGGHKSFHDGGVVVPDVIHIVCGGGGGERCLYHSMEVELKIEMRVKWCLVAAEGVGVC